MSMPAPPAAQASAEWWHRDGIACVESHRFKDALESFARAEALAPDEPAIISARGVALEGLGRRSDAAACYRRAIGLAPDYASAHSNLGRLLRDEGDLSAALEHLRRAIACRPDLAHAHNNLGCVLEELERLDEAIASYQRAAQLAPQQPDFEYNLALALLRAGRYAQGWRALEARLRTNILRKIAPPPGVARWDGRSPLGGRTLVLIAEQGFGDSMLFCRYGALLNERGIRPALQAPAPVAELLASSGYFERLVPAGSALEPQAHLWFPLMSLPLLFPEAPAGEPAAPYLKPEPARVALWRERLAGLTGVRVGICWQGGRGSELGVLKGRSMPLECLAPLAALEAVDLVSLQTGYGAEQLASCAFRERIHEWPELGDFAHTAALIANLDLVVTVDTAVAHMSGATGRQAWVALHHLPSWQWRGDAPHTPWYPGLRLFRQSQAGNWRTVVAEIARALAELAGG